MRLKKRYIAVALAAIFAGVSYSWTYTPYGRLDYAAALSTRALTINMKLKPDPNADLEFVMPINLFFAVAMIWPKDKVGEVKEVAIAGEGGEIPARVYQPPIQGGAPGPEGSASPIIVYYHGGGFVLGNVEQFDGLARSLTKATNAVVVSVDYRLAPAHPYPAAVDDAYAALLWVAANAASIGGDASRIAVAGDSAGGNLATVVALMARDKGGPPIMAQLLYYPVTDLTGKRYESGERFIDGYGLSREAGAAFNKAYVGHIEDRTDPYISPLYAPSLAGLPPALVFTGGFDPLTDSAKLYIQKLKEAGVETTAIHYADTIHGFLSAPPFPHRRRAFNETAGFWLSLTGDAPPQ